MTTRKFFVLLKGLSQQSRWANECQMLNDKNKPIEDADEANRAMLAMGV